MTAEPIAVTIEVDTSGVDAAVTHAELAALDLQLQRLERRVARFRARVDRLRSTSVEATQSREAPDASGLTPPSSIAPERTTPLRRLAAWWFTR